MTSLSGVPVVASGESPRGFARAFFLLPVAIAAFVLPLAFVARELPQALDAWLTPFRDDPMQQRLLFTLAQAVSSTVIGVAIGLLASWLLSHHRGIAFALLLTPFLIALATPAAVLALGIWPLLGPHIVGPALIIGAHAVVTAALTVWLTTGAWGVVGPRMVEQARLLGASGFATWRLFGWPVLRGPLLLAGALGMTHALIAVGTVMILGSSTYWTWEATLLVEARGGVPLTGRPNSLEFTPVLAVMALVQLVLVAILLLGTHRVTFATGRRIERSTGIAVGGAVVLLALGAAMVTPFAIVIREAVLPNGGLDAGAFERVLDARVGGIPGGELSRWSATYAVTAGIAATAFAWFAAPAVWRARHARGAAPRLLATLLLLPVALTPVVLALGVREAMLQFGVELQATWAILFGVHTLVAYPFAVRILSTVRRDEAATARVIEAAVLLGQPPLAARWQLEGARKLRALVASTLACGAIGLAEVGAASLIAPARGTPASVGILEAAQEAARGPGARLGDVPAPETFALAVVLTTTAVIAFILGEWLRRTTTTHGASEERTA